MFKKQPILLNGLLHNVLRNNGLETPLLQRRLINAWDEAAGQIVARYTEEKSIRNQTLWVKILNPAVRADLQMRRSGLVAELNAKVGSQIITDIRIY